MYTSRIPDSLAHRNCTGSSLDFPRGNETTSEPGSDSWLKKNNRSWRTGDKSMINPWFKSMVFAVSTWCGLHWIHPKALSPKHRSQALKQPAMGDKLHVVCRSKSPNQPVVLSGDQYNVLNVLITQPLWVALGYGSLGQRNVLIVIFRSLWYSTSSTSLSSSPISRCLTAIEF